MAVARHVGQSANMDISDTLDSWQQQTTARLEMFASNTGIELAERLTSSVRAVVHKARYEGHVVVVKAAHSAPGAQCDQMWLQRHEASPQVLIFDAAEAITVLEHVEGPTLRDIATTTLIDWTDETMWIEQIGAVNMQDQRHLVENVVDLVQNAFDAFLAQHTNSTVDADSADKWFTWARRQSPQFKVVAFDIISKNTLVTARGWSAIDPWCVSGPACLPAVRWAADRARNSPQGPDMSVAHSFSALRDDTTNMVCWLPVALLWTLCWVALEYPERQRVIETDINMAFANFLQLTT